MPNGEQGEGLAQLFQKVIWIIQRKQQKPSSNLKVFQPTMGDTGTMTDEGLLLYGGRMDFQIKFNGYQIELENVPQNQQIEVYWLSSRSIML